MASRLYYAIYAINILSSVVQKRIILDEEPSYIQPRRSVDDSVKRIALLRGYYQIYFSVDNDECKSIHQPCLDFPIASWDKQLTPPYLNTIPDPDWWAESTKSGEQRVEHSRSLVHECLLSNLGPDKAGSNTPPHY